MEAAFSSFGHLVKELREAHDLTQAGLARQLGYSLNTISKIEMGRRRPSKELLDRLATLFDIPPTVRPTFHRLGRTGVAAEPAAVALPPVLQPPPAPPPLPTFLTPFRGRTAEAAALDQWLVQDRRRLVTLTGLGGIGKTRLAVEVATRLAAAFPDGSVFVDLSAIQDPALLWPALAQAFGQPAAAASAPAAGLVPYLADKHVLLVLDNCEQIPRLGPLLQRLLAQAPGLSLLLTSRTTLRIPGEQVVPVEPFSLPPPGPHTLADLATYPVMQLFVERAQEVLGSFALTPYTAPLVAQLCRQLEGIPLALELAAAWLRLLPLENLLSRLEQRLELLEADLLTDRPAHQAGLRAALAWSYDLLPPAEQEVLATLSVFVGSWTLEAAEALLGRTLLGSLRMLAESNLIGHEAGTPGELRFTMLATVREFAGARLARETAATLQRAHAHYYLDWVEQEYNRFYGPNPQRDTQLQTWIAQLEAEHDNLRAALRWMVEQGEYAGAAQLSSGLVGLWQIGGYVDEGRRWLAAALVAEGAPTPNWARALAAAGFMEQLLGHYEAAQRYYERSLPIWRAHQEAAEIARILRLLGTALTARGFYAAAAAAYGESLELYEQLGDLRGQALVGLAQARLAQAQGLSTQTAQHYHEAVAAHRRQGNVLLLAGLLLAIGHNCVADQAYAQAVEFLEEGRDLLRGVTLSRQHLIEILSDLGAAYTGQGRHKQALASYQEALAVWAELKDNLTLVDCLEGLSSCLIKVGKLWHASYLLGFTTHWRNRAQVVLEAFKAVAQIQQVTYLRAQLGAPEFDVAWVAGERASTDIAILESRTLIQGLLEA